MMYALAFLFFLVPQQDEADAVVDRMQERVEHIEKLGWNVWTFSGIRNFSSDKGIDVQSRFRRGAGCRTQITHMGCADADVKPPAGGWNHFVLIHTPETVSFALAVVKLEIPRTDAFPYVLLRSKRGDPVHSAVDPVLLPSLPMPEFLYLDEAIIKYTLSPKILLGHEPGLRVAGRQKFDGKDCIVLVSERDATPFIRGIAEDWYPVTKLRKTFYVTEADARLVGMELKGDQRGEQKGSDLHYKARVIKTFDQDGVALPKKVEIIVSTGDGEPLSFILKNTTVADDR